MSPAAKTSVAVMMMLLTAITSVASANQTAPLPLLADRASAPAAPTVITLEKAALNQAELAKYQALAGQAQFLAGQEAAGASDTTKIVVGVVCVVVLSVALAKALEGAAASQILASAHP